MATVTSVPNITKEEYVSRFHRVQDAMTEQGYDALVLFSDSTRSSNVLYLVDFKPLDGYTDIAWAVILLPREGDPTLYVSQMNLLWGQEKAWFTAKVFRDLADDLLSLRHAVGRGRVGVAGLGFMPVPIYELIRGAFALDGPNLVAAEPFLGPIKATKSDAEIALLRRAGALTAVGLDAIKSAVTQPGDKTEREIAAYATAEIFRQGGDGAAFDIQIQSGPHAAYNNIRSTDREVRPGDSILIEMGARYKEYRTDIARGATYGAAEIRQTEIIRAAAQAQEAGCAAARPGVRAGELNSVIERSLVDSGYAEYSAEARGYGTGHGIGTDIEEEEPWIRPGSEFVLGENMVLALKASIFVPGYAGVRVEDEIRVTSSGAEVLTPYPHILAW
jgi:Xaa-Pro aminopeptidase